MVSTCMHVIVFCLFLWGAGERDGAGRDWWMILNVHYFKKKSEGGDFAQCVCGGEGEAGDTHSGYM